MKEHTKDKT